MQNCLLNLVVKILSQVEIKCQLDATDDIYCRFYCCNKYHLLHLVGILFPHIKYDARSESLQS